MSRVAVLAALVTTLGAASAQASTSIGQLPSGSPTIDSCPGGSPTTVWQNQAPTGVVTAASGGVITTVTTQQSASQAGHHFKVKVVDLVDRSFSPAATITIRSSSDPLAIAGTGAPESFTVHIPIAAGQGIAMFSAEGFDCGYSTSDSNDQMLFNGDPEPGVGTSISAQDGSMSARVPLQATIEPDADGDGFGDETQDGCPNDPSLHVAPCTNDASVSATVTPSTIGVGDLAVISGTIGNAGPGQTSDAVLHIAAGPGLQIVSSLPATACTFSTDLACTVGIVAKGASIPFIAVVKGTATGAHTLGASIAASNDSNAANNAASSTVNVQNQVPLVCTVPSLKGATKAFAKKLLAATHCKLGKTSRKKSKSGSRGTVIKQSKKPKSVLPAGSKVNVTLRK
ncbi:MAG TPA: PASTA domain-containing protein [Solirubrobacteraceae bacterium]|nr:PASTA domain-containing protein [Solirubrobacteraceae bacterium]